jgi:serine phosphatase RsbU (regulator of sigma subunit)
MHLTIRWKFILSIAITLLVTYLVLIPWDYRWQRETAALQIQNLANERAHGLAGSLNERFAAGERQAEMVVNRIVSAAPVTRSALTEALRDINNNLAIVLVMEPSADGVDKSVPIEQRGLPGIYVLSPMGGGRGGRGGGFPGGPGEFPPGEGPLDPIGPPDLEPGMQPPQRGGPAPFGMMAPGGGGFQPEFGGRLNRGGRGGRGGEDPGQFDPQMRGGRGGRAGRGGEDPNQFDLQQMRGGRGGFGQRGGRRGGQLSPVEAAEPNLIKLYHDLIDNPRSLWIGPQQAFMRSEAGLMCAYGTPIIINEKFRGIAVTLVPVGRELMSESQRRVFGRGPASAPSTAPASTDDDVVVVIDENAKLRWPEPLAVRGTPIELRPSLLDKAQAAGMTQLVSALRLAIGGEEQIVPLSGASQAFPMLSDQQAYWVSFSPITSNGWVVAAAIPESQFMARINERLWQRVLLLLAALVLLLMITALISIRITRPITQMAAAVGQLARGDLDAHVSGVNSKDELGQLAGAFNTMTRQLKSHVAALTEQTAARESVEAELRIARQIQTDLLPRSFPPFPDRHEFDLHAINVPAQRVAGDFYDFFFVSDTLLTITIADVSGKGVPAALLMAVTRTIIRNLASEGLSPKQIADRANAMLLHDMSESMFVTVFLLQYDTSSGRIVYVNCGHPAPYRITHDGESVAFGAQTSPILGVCASGADWQFEQHEESLNVGEMLLLYTDGVTEARSPDGRMLGASGVERLITKYRNKSVEAICVSFVDELNRYQNNYPADDITLVALKRRK